MTPPFSSPRARAFRQALQKIRAAAFFWSSKFNQNADTSWEPSYTEKVASASPTWAPRWSPSRPKNGKNRCKNRSNNQCLLGSIFGAMLVDYSSQNGAKLAPKWEQKSMLTSKGRFYKSAYKTDRISMIFEVPGVEKLIKNRLKIDPKTRSTWEGIFAPIFLRF